MIPLYVPSPATFTPDRLRRLNESQESHCWSSIFVSQVDILAFIHINMWSVVTFRLGGGLCLKRSPVLVSGPQGHSTKPRLTASSAIWFSKSRFRLHLTHFNMNTPPVIGSVHVVSQSHWHEVLLIVLVCVSAWILRGLRWCGIADDVCTAQWTTPSVDDNKRADNRPIFDHQSPGQHATGQQTT